MHGYQKNYTYSPKLPLMLKIILNFFFTLSFHNNLQIIEEYDDDYNTVKTRV